MSKSTTYVVGHAHELEGTIVIHRAQHPVQEAYLAMELALRMAEAGVLTPRIIATASCEIAEAMWREFEDRGWLLDVPEPEKRESKT